MSSGTLPECRIIRVSNVSSSATLEHMTTLFGFLGEIVNIELYTSDPDTETNFKLCFVEFAKPNCVAMAQHLTNTVFIDKALLVTAYKDSKIPDRETALASNSVANHLTSSNHGVVNQLTRNYDNSRDRDSNRDRDRTRDRDRYHGRHTSPRDLRLSRRSRSRDREILPRRRSRSRSREKGARRRSRSRESKRRRSRSRSRERSKSKHHKSSRR